MLGDNYVGGGGDGPQDELLVGEEDVVVGVPDREIFASLSVRVFPRGRV